VLEQRAFDAASRDDPRPSASLHDLGFIKKPSKLDAQRLMDHMERSAAGTSRTVRLKSRRGG